MKPIIGITGNYDDETGAVLLKDYYVKSIDAVGGVPIILPPVRDEVLMRKYLSICQGVLLSGGGDIDPAWWGENPVKGLGRISLVRDYFELQLTRMAVINHKPVLGICRGCQIMNVAAGGTLIQDLPGEFEHNQNAPRDLPFHGILIEKGSRLASIVGHENIRVNSFHHQAVNFPGRGLHISAYAPDGTAEAVEDPMQIFFVGVQWHPECLNDNASTHLFEAFIDSAQGDGLEYYAGSGHEPTGGGVS